MEQGHCVILYDPQSFTALFEKVFLPTGGVCSRKRRVQILQCLIIIKKIFVFFISNLKEGKIKRQLQIIVIPPPLAFFSFFFMFKTSSFCRSGGAVGRNERGGGGSTVCRTNLVRIPNFPFSAE